MKHLEEVIINYDKKLMEANKEIDRLKEENNYYFKVNNELSTLNTSLRSDRDKYKNIIKEVREYIEERYNGEVLTHTFDKDNVGELLEILKGE